MQVLARWRNILALKDSFVKTTTTTQLALFHCTPTLSNRRQEKQNFGNKSSEQPSKKYIRFEVRQKRADAKRALKDILYKGYSKVTLEDYSQVDGRMNWNAEYVDDSGSSVKTSRQKSSIRGSNKARYKKMRRKLKREDYSDDDNHDVSKATFGDRSYTWSYKAWEEAYSQKTTHGFEWREHSSPHGGKNRDWRNESDMESDDEANAIGSTSERITLGLSPSGPLNIEDVKNAFRLSALKWHPDKHQGPAKVLAENKFKLCVSAYKSLCSALSPS